MPAIVPIALRPAGAIGATPVSIDITTADGNILACPFSTDNTDLTGNHSFSPAGTFSSDGYNLETVFDSDAAGRLEDLTNTDHQIATASPVTFGGFIRLINPPQVSTPYLIASSVSGGAGNHNYSLVFVTGDLNLQHGPAGTLTPLGWLPDSVVPANQAREDGWVHVVYQLVAGRATGRLFLNGKQFGADQTSLTVGVPVGSDRLALAGVSGTAAGDVDAFHRNWFISDTLMSVTTIRRLAEQSFGHGLPA